MLCFAMARAIMATMVDPIVSQLAEVSLLDPNGAPIRLGTLWAEHPIILAMIRHFG